MNHISNYTNKTTVKTLSMIFATLFFVSLKSQAGVSSAAVAVCSNAKDPDACIAQAKIEADQDRQDRINRDRKDDCKQTIQRYTDAKKAIAKSCGDTGIGSDTSDCQQQVSECNANMSTGVAGTLSSTAAAYLNATGSQYAGVANAFSAAKGSTCPQMSGKTYFNRKDSLNKDIDSTQKELADLNDEKAKIQDEFNKQIQDLQDDLNKAQEDLDKQKLEMKDKTRKQLADFQNSQNQAKEELRKKSSDVLSLRGQLISSQQDQALKLIAMSDASGKRACMKAVNDAKKAYDAISTSASSNYIAKAKQKKQDLISTYNDCMDSFEQQRTALNKSKKQEQDQLTKAISDATQSADELSNSMSTASSQLAEMQQDAQTEQDNATQKVVKLMQTNQTKMLAAQQKMQSNLQTIEAKNTSLSQKLNRLTSEQAALGPVPADDSTQTAKSVGSDITANQEIIDDNEDAYRSCMNDAKASKAALRSENTK